MANGYFRGEQIGFAATLKNSASGTSVVVTDMEVTLLFFRAGATKTLFEREMTYDSETQTFAYVWDTAGLKGEFEIRAVAGNDDTGIVVSNEALSITVEPYSPASYSVKTATETATSSVATQTNSSLEIRDLTLELSVTNSSLELDAIDVSTATSHLLTFAKLIKGEKGDTGATGATGATGPQGPTGATGAAGPNEVSTTTATTFNGLLKGNGSTVVLAVEDTDYIKSLSVSTTWSALKALRDAGTLVAGRYYRITDYVTTTGQDSLADSDTSKTYKSAQHQFDVIVLALDASHLSETAWAMWHSGDTYFSQSKLNAWKLQYCLDNDLTRFGWADATNGKGVIYRMVDEFENDIPYDFKNVQFKRYKITATAYAVNAGLVGKYAACTAISKDGTALVTYDTSDYVWCYTFTYGITDSTDAAVVARGLRFDMSLYRDNAHLVGNVGVFAQCVSFGSCHDNPSSTYRDIQQLNNNVFLGRFVNELKIALESHHNTMGTWDNASNGDIGLNVAEDCFRGNIIYDRCCHNHFCSCWQYNVVGNLGTLTSGSGLSWNQFNESHFQYNCIGNDFTTNAAACGFQRNVIGDGFCGNNAGSGFVRNTIGGTCQYNSFGQAVNDNTIGDTCKFNSFGNMSIYNTLGDNFQNNNIGPAFVNNALGDGCLSNVFATSVDHISFGDNVVNSKFDRCSYVSFVTDSAGGTLADGFANGEIKTCAAFVKIVCTDTVSTTKVKNYIIDGIQGTSSSYKEIAVERGRAYKTKVSLNSSGAVKQYCEADLIK